VIVRSLVLSMPLLASVALVPIAFSGRDEAPTGFDDETNGFLSQGEFEARRQAFEGQQGGIAGIGRAFGARSCGECHQIPVSGAASQASELRGSARTQRAFLSTLGDGFVEAIADDTLEAISAAQPARMRGEVTRVPVLEAEGALRVGRFGWKSQHASLVSFATHACREEMGITNSLAPGGDAAADPEEPPTAEPNGADVEAYAAFMRSTKAPPRDATLAQTPAAIAGEALFRAIGCDMCHVPEIITAPPGTVINGGRFVVPAALGGKRIHAYSDFLLHDVGTGEPLRTPPLWGVRTRSRLMHDGASRDMSEAILRHDRQAATVTSAFRTLPATKQNQLLTFLESL
jgi:CxxC motif-containing protein (DUF1111 family)